MDSVRGLYCMFIRIDVGAGGIDRVDPVVEAGAEIFRLDAADGVERAGLPDHQRRLVVGQDFLQLGGHLCGGLLATEHAR